MAYREIRASWYRLLFFFLCIAIGVGSIISLRSIVQNIRASVSRQAQTLLAADLQVTSSTPLNDETRTILAKYYQSPEVIAHAESIELATMLRPLNNANVASKQVELRAVQSQFPFYGEMILSNGQAYNHSLLKDRGILVKPELLQQLNLKIGDKVKIGKLEFSIRGTIEREPGNTLTGFSLGPRIFANYEDIIEAIECHRYRADQLEIGAVVGLWVEATRRDGKDLK